jgi:hypothetical protein
MVGPKIFQILGLNLGHHEEFQNGSENKIHIRESSFRVLEKFRFFRY